MNSSTQPIVLFDLSIFAPYAESFIRQYPETPKTFEKADLPEIVEARQQVLLKQISTP